jgi:flagellar assembly protein FliH
MHLSKVFRVPEGTGLQKIGFREFGPNGEIVEGGLQIEQAIFAEVFPQTVGERERETVALPVPQPAGMSQSELEKRIETAYLQGKEEGLQQAGEHFDISLEMLARGIEEVSRLRQTLLENSTHDMLRLVMSISRQVVHSQITINREVILATISKALNASVRSDSYHIRVNQEDLDLVTEKKPLFLASINGLKNIAFEADPLIERGGCMVESELGEVDATIENQLGEIRRTLLSAMEKN